MSFRFRPGLRVKTTLGKEGRVLKELGRGNWRIEIDGREHDVDADGNCTNPKIPWCIASVERMPPAALPPTGPGVLITGADVKLANGKRGTIIAFEGDTACPSRWRIDVVLEAERLDNPLWYTAYGERREQPHRAPPDEPEAWEIVEVDGKAFAQAAPEPEAVAVTKSEPPTIEQILVHRVRVAREFRDGRWAGKNGCGWWGATPAHWRKGAGA